MKVFFSPEFFLAFLQPSLLLDYMPSLLLDHMHPFWLYECSQQAVINPGTWPSQQLQEEVILCHWASH